VLGSAGNALRTVLPPIDAVCLRRHLGHQVSGPRTAKPFNGTHAGTKVHRVVTQHPRHGSQACRETHLGELSWPQSSTPTWRL
jgi:hypothetical protein